MSVWFLLSRKRQSCQDAYEKSKWMYFKRMCTYCIAGDAKHCPPAGEYPFIPCRNPVTRTSRGTSMMKRAFVVREEVLEGGYRHQQAQTCRGKETGLKKGDENVE